MIWRSFREVLDHEVKAVAAVSGSDSRSAAVTPCREMMASPVVGDIVFRTSTDMLGKSLISSKALVECCSDVRLGREDSNVTG